MPSLDPRHEREKIGWQPLDHTREKKGPDCPRDALTVWKESGTKPSTLPAEPEPSLFSEDEG